MLAAPTSGAVATYEAAPKFKHSRRKKAEGVYRVASTDAAQCPREGSRLGGIGA
jgi:hypothetical protein